MAVDVKRSVLIIRPALGLRDYILIRFHPANGTRSAQEDLRGDVKTADINASLGSISRRNSGESPLCCSVPLARRSERGR